VYDRDPSAIAREVSRLRRAKMRGALLSLSHGIGNGKKNWARVCFENGGTRARGFYVTRWLKFVLITVNELLRNLRGTIEKPTTVFTSLMSRLIIDRIIIIIIIHPSIA